MEKIMRIGELVLSYERSIDGWVLDVFWSPTEQRWWVSCASGGCFVSCPTGQTVIA